jgi:hypothetical protein
MRACCCISIVIYIIFWPPPVLKTYPSCPRVTWGPPTSINISPKLPSNSILVVTVPSRFDITSPCSVIREKEDIDCYQHAQDLLFLNRTSPFYSTIICTETALAVNFASSILTPVSFSPLSQSHVLIYPLFPTLIAPITVTFYDIPFLFLFRLHSTPLRSKVMP